MADLVKEQSISFSGSSLHFFCHHFNILILVNLSDLAVIYRHNQIFTNMFALIILIFSLPSTHTNVVTQ